MCKSENRRKGTRLTLRECVRHMVPLDGVVLQLEYAREASSCHHDSVFQQGNRSGQREGLIGFESGFSLNLRWPVCFSQTQCALVEPESVW
jgi:hypothetical protein